MAGCCSGSPRPAGFWRRPACWRARYQGLLRLRPQDARALADGYDWQPVAATASPGTYQWDTPAQMWPALAAFSPAEPQWLHSGAYAEAHFQHGRWGDLYLDPAAGFAFFVLQDH